VWDPELGLHPQPNLAPIFIGEMGTLNNRTRTSDLAAWLAGTVVLELVQYLTASRP
jgi:hypothetical protein